MGGTSRGKSCLSASFVRAAGSLTSGSALPPILQPLRQRLRRDGFGDAVDERLGFAEGRLDADAVVELVPGLHVRVVREAVRRR